MDDEYSIKRKKRYFTLVLSKNFVIYDYIFGEIILSGLLHQRLSHRGFDFTNHFEAEGFWNELGALDLSLRDIMNNEGFSSGWFIAPGVPRIRPILIYLSSEVAREEGTGEIEGSRLHHLALATELFYGAILIHDLTLGKQGGKRRRIARKLLGKALEWYGGTKLLTRALEVLTMTRSADIVKEFVLAMKEVQEAQEESHEWTEQMPKEEDIINFAENYTGAMFAFACRSGGWLSQAERRNINLLGRYGRELGVAWQLTEELAAMDSNQELAKQSLEEQLATKRPFYPVIRAAQENSEIESLWTHLLHNDDPASLDKLNLLVQNSAGIPMTRQKIGEYSWTARKIARNLPQSHHRNHLEYLAQALAK